MDQNVIKNREKSHDIIVKNRKKLPEVRQTLTSKYRMLKANPLLMHELGKKLGSNGADDFSFKPLKALVTVLDNKNATDIICKLKPETKKIQERLESREPRKLMPTKNANLMHKPLSSTVKSTKSTYHLEHSVSNVPLAGENVAHIKTSATNFTPSSSNRVNHNKPSEKQKVPFVTNSQELSRRLSKWLQQRGKDFGEYHHLKCFGLNEENKKLTVCDTEKENLEPKLVNSSNNHTLEINASNQDENNSDNLSGIAQDALLDLQKLILEGYPPEQCQVWLQLIKQKYRHLEEEPQYWECRAALEQSRGNINSAVECYKTAIIHGAEVQSVDKHLDQLLYKFSLLNISKEASFAKNDKSNKIVKDARNIFKSSIIQFAVQERISRRKNKGEMRIEKALIATPVRRSTRLSRSAFTSTPGIQLFSSLQEIDNSVRNTLNFQCNNALKD